MRFLHIDSQITINDLTLPLAIFQRYEPDYTPPGEGFIGRDYVPGQRHLLFGRGHSVSLSLSWPEGDNYLAKEKHYRLLYTQQQRRSSSHVRSILRPVQKRTRGVQSHAREQRQSTSER